MVSPSVLCLAYNVLQGIATFLRAAIDRASARRACYTAKFLLRHSFVAYCAPRHVYSISCVSNASNDSENIMPGAAVGHLWHDLPLHGRCCPCSTSSAQNRKRLRWSTSSYGTMEGESHAISTRVMAMTSRVSPNSATIPLPSRMRGMEALSSWADGVSEVRQQVC